MLTAGAGRRVVCTTRGAGGVAPTLVEESSSDWETIGGGGAADVRTDEINADCWTRGPGGVACG